MILYSDDTSPWCAPVRAAIYAKGLDIPMEGPPGGFKSAAHRAATVTGTIPCLMLDDGSPLPESAVIIAYLDDKFPERPLTSKNPETQARIALLLRLAENGLLTAIVQLFHDLSEGVEGARERAAERITTGLERLEHFVAADGYAAGPAFTEADCVLGPALFGVKAFAGMLGEPDLMASFPKLAAYDARVVQHPAIAKVLGELAAALAANAATMPA
jgi:glutathione S-transferase